MTDSAAADIARAEGLAGQALAASPRSPLAHFAKGQVLRAQGRYEEAIPEYETVIAFNRNWVGAYAASRPVQVLDRVDRGGNPARGASHPPQPPRSHIGIWYCRIGLVHLLQSRTDEAILWLEKARNANPALPFRHAWLASAYALKGETERAAAELAEARRLSGDDRYSSIARLKAGGVFGMAVPKVRALFDDHLFRRPAQGRDAGRIERRQDSRAVTVRY